MFYEQSPSAGSASGESAWLRCSWRWWQADSSFWTRPACIPARSKRMGTLTNAYRRANEEASHPGRKSGNPPDKKWNTAELLKEIDTLAKEFAAKASHARLDSRVREFFAQPTDKIAHWLEKNTTYSNVAAQTMISISGSAGLPLLSGTSTATVVIRIK